MNRLDAFMHDLHFHIDRTKPPDRVVDWEDGPLAFKLYRGLPVFPLAADIPLAIAAEGANAPGRRIGLRSLGHLLWYAYGLTELSHSVQSSFSSGTDLFQMYRRFAPSGGALYPSELYVYLKLDTLPAGVYHYDAAHHRLVLLREGDCDAFLQRALGERFERSRCCGAAFVSAMFWKNFFKYDSFAYRLQGLDAGTMIGQLLEAAERFGVATAVHFQFADRAIHHLLGLSELEESVYAVVALSDAPAPCPPCLGTEPEERGGSDRSGRSERQSEDGRSAEAWYRELPPVSHEHYVRSKRIKPYPLLLEMNEASMLASVSAPALEAFARPPAARRKLPGIEGVVRLPAAERLAYDWAAASRRRFSPDTDFALGPVSLGQLSALLRETAASLRCRCDLDGGVLQEQPRLSLYVCLHHVEGIEDGAYVYDIPEHALVAVREGDLRLWLQIGMNSDNVNLLQVPLVFHVAGDRNHYTQELGYRGYRIQQMEAGMLVQRLLLAASALGLGGHPLLDYDARLCDELYRLPAEGLTSLIQVPIGPYRPCPKLAGGLHG
ncbi:SagB family peptide dehydrogenase [Paenibacillus doosanensis]|uniref:SagB family peptide dehydrogenase n=1 Tax=Paenibacillus doosanensis TaxID=1229154 RepID=UPI0021802B93|nr:SagB family peptide dehydrogenase [Paenibacillus doosanensis]MCS7462064.1 SagB family peptide dehydrogenase [Paenibacillus doosanensis]